MISGLYIPRKVTTWGTLEHSASLSFRHFSCFNHPHTHTHPVTRPPPPPLTLSTPTGEHVVTCGAEGWERYTHTGRTERERERERGVNGHDCCRIAVPSLYTLFMILICLVIETSLLAAGSIRSSQEVAATTDRSWRDGTRVKQPRS